MSGAGAVMAQRAVARAIASPRGAGLGGAPAPGAFAEGNVVGGHERQALWPPPAFGSPP